MMNQELTDEELLYASPEDWAFYNKCIEGLPIREGKKGNFWDKNGHEIPWGSGPHIAKYFRETIELVKPKGILEIGLCLGAGSSMWLNLCDADVLSIDISDREETIEAAEILMYKHPKRFRYFIGDSTTFATAQIFPFQTSKFTQYWDLCWLDGSHDEESVTKDIQACKDLGIPYILFDDIMERFGPGVLPAIAKFPELELVKDMNNLRLYKWAAK